MVPGEPDHVDEQPNDRPDATDGDDSFAEHVWKENNREQGHRYGRCEHRPFARRPLQGLRLREQEDWRS